MQRLVSGLYLHFVVVASSSIRSLREQRDRGTFFSASSASGSALLSSSGSGNFHHQSNPYAEDFKSFGKGSPHVDPKVARHPSIHNAADVHREVDELEAKIPGIIDEAELEEDKALQTVHSIAGTIVVPAMLVFMLSLAVAHVLSIWEPTQWIPESAAILTTAMLLGRLMKALVEHGALTNAEFVLGAATLLNLLLLPIIIFVSGWSLRRLDFIYQFNPILIFAIMGTLISTFVIGYGSYFASMLGLHAVSDLRSNMAFGALISAVDPVATLVTYKALQVEPLLNIMVFGESTINDAVAVVLFSIMNERWNSMTVGGAVWRGMQLLFGSMVFGMLVACLIILVMRLTKMKQGKENQQTATLFMWCSAFLVYSGAECTEVFSGIIATLFAGIVFGAYGRLHLQDAGADADKFFEMTASMADKTVFVLCGAATGVISSTRGYMFGCVAIVLCLIGRACAVAPCGLVVNALKRHVGDPHTLTWQHLVMMTHGGLRGAIALVLALQIDATWCNFKATIVNGTFIVICVLLIFFGGSTEFLLKKLKVPMGDEYKWDTLRFKEKGPLISVIERLDTAMVDVLGDVEPNKEPVANTTPRPGVFKDHDHLLDQFQSSVDTKRSSQRDRDTSPGTPSPEAPSMDQSPPTSLK